MSNETIESREIRGISAKTLVTIIICTGSIILSVMGSYYGLKGDINDVRNSKDSDAKLYDIRLKVLEQKIDYQRIEFEEFRRSYESTKTQH